MSCHRGEINWFVISKPRYHCLNLVVLYMFVLVGNIAAPMSHEMSGWTYPWGVSVVSSGMHQSGMSLVLKEYFSVRNYTSGCDV